MRHLQVFTAIGLLVAASTGFASELSNAAANVQPGKWVELVTNNIQSVIGANGASGFIFGYAEDIQWNPIARKLLYAGGDHNDLERFVTYTESSNSWQIPTQPSWIPGGTNHGYDHHAMNPATGMFYTRQGYHSTMFQRYDSASGVWSSLPVNDLLEYDQCCAGVEFFPEMDGLVWVQGGETSGGGGVFLYRESTNRWTRLGRDLPMGIYHNFAEYNPVHKVMIFGGGNNGGSTFYVMNASGQITRQRVAPLQMGTQESIVTVDPVSGEYLVFAARNTFYSYDVLTDTWKNRSGSTPLFGEEVHGIVGTPISTYGVNLFVTARENPFKVFLYRHSPGGGSPAPTADTAPPTAPGGLTAALGLPTQVNLSWSASTDNVAVSGYRVFRNNTQVGTSSTTTFQEGSLAALTAFGYKVQAFDAAGNASAFSNTFSITTGTISIIPPPPGNPAPDPVSSDFETRRRSPGVIRSFSFDSQSETDPHIYAPWGTTVKRAKVVTDVVASGTGSLRFDVPSNSGSDSSGSFNLNFSDDLSVQFGEGEEFYVQWRQRFTPEFINTKFDGGGGWKQCIIGEGDHPGETVYSCTQLEIVTQNTNQRGFPQMYHSCGGKDGHYESFEMPVNGSDFVLQNNIPGCLYSLVSNSSSRANYIPPCFGYQSNKWMTFQVHVKIGTWYHNDRNYHRDSLIQLWIANEGEPSQLVINYTGYDIANNNPEAQYGKVWLLPYHTGKSSAQVHPQCYVWYDDLIISRQRIPDPTGGGGTPTPGPDAVAPQAPLGLSVR